MILGDFWGLISLFLYVVNTQIRGCLRAALVDTHLIPHGLV